jgi:2-polyprenyl-3-methyl-5-hydroxy-6-metoxy-1,4-benzoquinol methylase
MMLSIFLAMTFMYQPDEIDALNKKCYDARAAYWDRLPFPAFLPEAIQRNKAPGQRALDIGSGTGRLAAWLAKEGFQVVCLDPSDEMVRRTKAMGLPTLQTTIQTFQTSEKFDLILAILSLIHVQKKEMPAALAKIWGMLNQDGIFALAMIEGQGEGVGETDSKFPRYFAYYNRQEILDLTAGHFTLLEEYRSGGYLVFIFKKIS